MVSINLFAVNFTFLYICNMYYLFVVYYSFDKFFTVEQKTELGASKDQPSY